MEGIQRTEPKVEVPEILGTVTKIVLEATPVEVPILPARKGSLVTRSASFDYAALDPDGTFDF